MTHTYYIYIYTFIRRIKSTIHTDKLEYSNPPIKHVPNHGQYVPVYFAFRNVHQMYEFGNSGQINIKDNEHLAWNSTPFLWECLFFAGNPC